MRRCFGALRCASLALALALMATGAGADLVVVSSSDPALTPGQVIADNQPVTLADTAQATLIAADGRTIRLKGPYAGISGGGRSPAADTGSDLVEQLSQLLEGRDRRKPTLGAVRALGPETKPPSSWDIDIARPGTWCVAAGEPVTLYRGGSDREDTLKITAEASGTAGTVPWPRGERRITVVPGDLPTEAHRAGWMAARGCRDQAIGLLDAL